MSPIPFSGNPLDRASEMRADPAWIASRRHASGSFIWPFWQLKPLLLQSAAESHNGARPAYIHADVAQACESPQSICVFLGLQGEDAIFGLDLQSTDDPAKTGPLAGLGFFCEARAAAQLLPPEEAAILGQAKALIDWHKRHGFCPNCGTRTMLADAGYRRHCDACGADHFPRTDPVVIMLATHGDACLVGRSARFPQGTFSALAGFVEPGETVEEAVAREVFEEAGVRVNTVSYFASQPWPFPSSLMIGCFAEAESRTIVLDEKELVEAFWLEKDRLRSMFAGKPDPELRIPPPLAIAHHLLKRFAEMP